MIKKIINLILFSLSIPFGTFVLMTSLANSYIILSIISLFLLFICVGLWYINFIAVSSGKLNKNIFNYKNVSNIVENQKHKFYYPELLLGIAKKLATLNNVENNFHCVYDLWFSIVVKCEELYFVSFSELNKDNYISGKNRYKYYCELLKDLVILNQLLI